MPKKKVWKRRLKVLRNNYDCLADINAKNFKSVETLQGEVSTVKSVLNNEVKENQEIRDKVEVAVKAGNSLQVDFEKLSDRYATLLTESEEIQKTCTNLVKSNTILSQRICILKEEISSIPLKVRKYWAKKK